MAVGFALVVVASLLTVGIAARLPSHSMINDEDVSKCIITILESIPENLTYDAEAPMHTSIYSGWKLLLSSAEKSIKIASSYWTLLNTGTNTSDPTAKEGEDIFNSLMRAGKERGIAIQIVQNAPSRIFPDWDTQLLQKNGAAEVRSLNMPKLVGGGILHTKMWLVDDKHFYLGSGNLDWRSLTQVKELGFIVMNCPKLANDMKKIFDVYWNMSRPGAVLPKKWPKSVETTFNSTSPMPIIFNDTFSSQVYLSSSPPAFCPSGRTTDIDSIISTIDQAEKFIHIAVMDYVPALVYVHPMKFWPVIDNKLREVAFNKKIEVRLLISKWPHTRSMMYPFLKSLNSLYSNNTNIKVKLFEVPCFTPSQCKIPYARVNHNKYMVTDKTAYIGTSNWSGDYFVSTAGIGFIVTATNGTKSQIRKDIADIFKRDWNSKYTHPLN